MARTLVIELPDDLEQQLVSQAEQLNLPLETVVLRSLSQTLNRPLPNVQKTLGAYVVIAEMLTRIREASLAGHTTTEVSYEPITLHLAQVMKEGGTIRNFQIVEQSNLPRLVINLPSHPIAYDLDHPILDGNRPDLPPELQTLLQNLNSEDPNDRANAAVVLGELYSGTQ